MVEPKKNVKETTTKGDQLGQIDDMDLVNSGIEDDLRCESIGGIGQGIKQSAQEDPALAEYKIYDNK